MTDWPASDGRVRCLAEPDRRAGADAAESDGLVSDGPVPMAVTDLADA